MIAAPVHPVPPRHGAAVEWWMYQVCRRLRGYQPTIICTHAEGYAREEEAEGVRYHRIQIGRLYRRLFQKITRLDPWSYVKRAARLIDAIQPAIVHVQNSPKLLTDLRRVVRTQTRYILHMQNEMQVSDWRHDDVLIADSRYLKSVYDARMPQASVDVITNGVDIETFRPAWEVESETRALKQKLGIPADKKIVMYAGRMSPEKGPLDLVRAFRELLRRRDDIFLVLIGELRRGDAANPRVRYGNEILAACDEIKTHCHLAGSIDPAHIHNYYVLADLVVVPSEFEEPFGMVAVEAMAAGVAVLAARKGGLKEFVHEGETGFLIANTKDYPGLAQRIGNLLDQPQALARIGRSARDYAGRHHNWEEVARQTQNVYAQMLGDAGSKMAAGVRR